jgi:hypothetical protein
LNKTGNSSPTTGDTGVDPRARDTGGAITYVDGLQVSVDSVPCTDGILQQLRGSGGNWPRLGEGASNDSLAALGAGPIKLDYLVPIAEGAHTIKLSVPELADRRNGGRIYFNLYIE